MSLHYLQKREPWKLCPFSHAVYRVSKTTLLSEHAVECRLCLLLVQTCVHCIASLVNLQNNRVYAPSNVKKRDIAPERLLRCRPMFSWSLTVSVAVSKLGCTKLFFVEPGVKVWQIQPRGFAEEADAASHVSHCQYQTRMRLSRIAHQHTVRTRQFSCCNRRHHDLSPPIRGILNLT